MVDGAGHLSPPSDVISYEPPAILRYGSLGVDKLDAYKVVLSDVIRADRTIGNTALIGMLGEAHGVSSTNFSMASWRRKNKRLERAAVNAACDAYDAIIDVATNGEPPIAIDGEVAVVSIGIAVDNGVGAIADGHIAVGGGAPIVADDGIAGSNSVAVSIEDNLATGISATITIEDITNTAIPIEPAIDAADAGIASGSIPAGPAINRFSRARPFYGPNVDPESAFKSGSIDSTIERTSPSPKRKAGRAEKKRRLSGLCQRGLCL